ncbi:m71l [Myxoma virus]|nr:m71l [Myxoma virus]
MASPSKTVGVSVYVIPVTERDPFEVIPDVKEEGKRFAEVSDVKKDAKAGGINDPTKVSFYYNYYVWRKVERSGGVDNFKDYFSGLCNLLCTSESRNSMARHFSLWEEYVKTPVKDPNSVYIVVLEDDTTLLDLTTIHKTITSMVEKNIDILQLRETLHNSNARNILYQGASESMHSYTGGYDFSLSAYIIKISAATRIVEEIIRTKGISTTLSYEMYKMERALQINRQVLNEASAYVQHNTLYVSNKRVNEMKHGLWNRVSQWMSGKFPNIAYFLSHPVVSFFGLFDITILGVSIVLFIILLLVFGINSKLLWFLAGTLITYIV